MMPLTSRMTCMHCTCHVTRAEQKMGRVAVLLAVGGHGRTAAAVSADERWCAGVR